MVLGPDVWLPKDFFMGCLLLDVILCSGDCKAWEDTGFDVGALTTYCSFQGLESGFVPSIIMRLSSPSRGSVFKGAGL